MITSPTNASEMHTNQLEDLLMKEHGINYKTARKIVLESRETLGMGKFQPWNETLKGAAERLYEIKYSASAGSKSHDGAANPHGNDTDSTMTPGTLQSLSYDTEDHNKHRGEQQQRRVASGACSEKGTGLAVDATEDPTETETATAVDETSTLGSPMTTCASSCFDSSALGDGSKLKKKKKLKLLGLGSLGRRFLPSNQRASSRRSRKRSTAGAPAASVVADAQD
jgi:hypothetical protein